MVEALNVTPVTPPTSAPLAQCTWQPLELGAVWSLGLRSGKRLLQLCDTHLSAPPPPNYFSCCHAGTSSAVPEQQELSQQLLSPPPGEGVALESHADSQLARAVGDVGAAAEGVSGPGDAHSTATPLSQGSQASQLKSLPHRTKLTLSANTNFDSSGSRHQLWVSGAVAMEEVCDLDAVKGTPNLIRKDAPRPPPVSRRAKLVTASVNFGLTAYATLTVAALKMLHCVWVPGTPLSERRLFIRGSVVCEYSGWQAPYILLVAFLVAIPATLPFAAAWSRRRGGAPWIVDVRLGVRRALVDSYHHRAYWWEAALMAQRLVSFALP